MTPEPSATVFRCWQCRGRTYVSDGQPDDGMMTGRVACPVCDGTGWLNAEDVVAHLRDVLGQPTGSVTR